METMKVVCRATEPGVERTMSSGHLRPVESPSFNIGEGETTVRGVFKVLVDFE